MEFYREEQFGITKWSIDLNIQVVTLRAENILTVSKNMSN